MTNRIFADISLLMIAFIWGITFVLVQNAISFLEPFSFNAIRFLMASILLILWLLFFERQQLKNLSFDIWRSGVFLGVWLFLGYAFQTVGLVFTTSSKAGFITGLSVVLVPLFSLIFLKQNLKLGAASGALLAGVGLFMLTAGDISQINVGDILVLFCAFAFAMHIIFTGKYSNHYPALLLTVIQISTVALLSFLCSLFFENWVKISIQKVIFSTDVLLALFITSVFATAVAFFAQTKFQKYTTAARVALIFAMEPVFAAIAGYFWAGERLSIGGIAGCFLILFGMILAELPSEKFIFTTKTKKSLQN